MTLIVTSHAISRYRERVAAVDYDTAYTALTSAAVQKAAEIGARYVRLGTGQRIVLEGSTVVSVIPSDNFKRQVFRKGLGRYGKSKRERVE